MRLGWDEAQKVLAASAGMLASKQIHNASNGSKKMMP